MWWARIVKRQRVTEKGRHVEYHFQILKWKASTLDLW